jgi:acetylornithine deacetylase
VSSPAELLRALVEIDSVNPTLVPGGAGEASLASAIHAWLAGAGLEVDLHEVRPGRPNVTARRKGRGGGPTLMLAGHTDTVGYDGMPDPLTPRVEGGMLFGRGAYDMKAGLAAAMWAAAQIEPGELAGDLVVAAVIDEEHSSLGTESLLARQRPDLAVVTEPTGAGLDVCIAHKGFAWGELTVLGRAAHGSRRDLGVDAIARSGHLLVELESLDGRLARAVPHPLLGSPSIHASKISGGREWSSYPGECRILVERRSLPGEAEDALAADLELLTDAASARCPGIEVRSRVDLVRPAFEISPGAELAHITRELARLGGWRSEFVGLAGWNDSALFAAQGIPTIVFGPGGGGAHADEEWADLGQLEGCAAVLEMLARTVCT